MVDANVFVIHPEKDDDVFQQLMSAYHEVTFGNTKLIIQYIDSSQPLQPYSDFGEKIRTYIDNSKCVLAIITANSKRSLWVNQEIGYTLGKDIPLLPVTKNSMVGRGCGFLHSNIDTQPIEKDQTTFPRIDQFFTGKFGPKDEKVITPLIMEAIEESQAESTGRYKLGAK